jgi:hypothetical protein
MHPRTTSSKHDLYICPTQPQSPSPAYLPQVLYQLACVYSAGPIPVLYPSMPAFIDCVPRPWTRYHEAPRCPRVLMPLLAPEKPRPLFMPRVPASPSIDLPA